MLFREDNVARADADAIRKGVGFYRWTHDIVEITGKDALEVLQKIYISNISKVAVGRSKYTASLDENGEIIDDVIVMHMADGLYWVSDLYGPRLLPWIEKRANALKNITIPHYTQLSKDIADALEEKEREEFTRLKVIKQRKNKAS